MKRRDAIAALVAFGFFPLASEAQQNRVYRIGVVTLGGAYSESIGGLREGLAELGFEEGKQYLFHVRDLNGDLRPAEATARSLESEKVDLIFALSISVALAAKRGTKIVPIVFYGPADPVANGLVATLRNPGGRLTGITSRFTDLAAKRLQLLKEILPKLREVVAFYNPANSASQRSMKNGREAARQLNVKLRERPVASVEELRAALSALRPGEVDAFFHVADGMVNSQARMMIEIANAKKLPTMFSNRENVALGGLAGYGPSNHAMGRLAARYVHSILVGADPKDLPVEQADRLYFVINLKAAKAIGLAIPPSALLQADEVIQ
jgi:putative ABC transport system substrate-binding protein